MIQIMGAVELGLIYGIVAVAVYLTFRIIDFPDLTVDGSFSLGAAVAAALIVKGHSPLAATFYAGIAGGLAGFLTGYLHLRWRILGLLAGILTMTALYSINLRVMGRPNIALLMERSLFDYIASPHAVLITLCGIVGILLLTITFLLYSNFGLGLRATGMNPRVARTYGIHVTWMMFFVLILSNLLVAFSGALFAQSQRFSDISMGTGTIVIGLAAVIVGETIFASRKIWVALVSCVLGSILYRITIVAALNANGIGLKASDLNLITASLIALTMIISYMKRSYSPHFRKPS